MIEKLFAENYGCLKKVETPPLGMLHAFIGPNDSGKSTLLRAARILTHCAMPMPNMRASGGLLEPDLEFAPGEVVWLGAQTPSGDYAVEFKEGLFHEGTQATRQAGMVMSRRLFGHGIQDNPHLAARSELNRAMLCRFDPDELRKRSQLLPDGAAVTFTDDRGAGLPGVYDSILNRGDGAFAEIRASLLRLFPAIKGLRLRAPTKTEKEIEIELKDGKRIAAQRMSEGLLYYLAFAALPHLSATSIVLVEEPENGLHPARIADVMRVLRDLSRTTQVLIATHSPLVINELSGNEVTVVRRTAEGNQLTLMKDTPNFEERSKVYALGELWVSYANGEDEAPLMTASPAK